MTPRDEHVEQYTPKCWTRSYNGFSGVDFAIEVDEKVLNGTVVQGISYSSSGTGFIIFLEFGEILDQDRECCLLLKASNKQGEVMVKRITGVKVVGEMVPNETLEITWKGESNWSKV